jgi:hypothetical protein
VFQALVATLFQVADRVVAQILSESGSLIRTITTDPSVKEETLRSIVKEPWQLCRYLPDRNMIGLRIVTIVPFLLVTNVDHMVDRIVMDP